MLGRVYNLRVSQQDIFLCVLPVVLSVFYWHQFPYWQIHYSPRPSPEESWSLLNAPLKPDAADGNMLVATFTFKKADGYVNRPT